MRRRIIGWLVLLLALAWGGQVVHASTLTAAQRQAAQKWYRDPQNVIGVRTQAALYQANEVTFAKLKGHPQIAVIVTSGKDEDELEEYANAQFKRYGFGQKDWDNGLLLTIEPKEHHYWLEVGYGLEPVVPDGAKDDIVNSAAIRLLTRGSYDAAIATIVANTVKRVQTHADAISTPARIAERRAHDRLVDQVSVGAVLLVLATALALAARFFVLRRRAAQILTTEPDRFPILAQITASGIVLDPDRVPGGGWALLNAERALQNSFAKVIRRDYVKWLAQLPDQAPQPYFYYRTDSPQLKAMPNATLAQLPSLWALTTDETRLAADESIAGVVRSEVIVAGAYAERFCAWLLTQVAEPDEVSETWWAFFMHVQPEDAALSDAELNATWQLILNHVQHPDTAQHTNLGAAGWAVSTYGPASLPSGGSGGFGSGGGGGASGGGGFGGSW